MVRFFEDAIARLRLLVPELAKFSVVGATGAVVDLGGTAVLYGTVHLGPLTSKGIALSAACVVTYLGSRFWTFRHRENQPIARELTLFILLNGVGLVIAEAVIAITAYAFGARDQLAYNAASILGTGLGTIFRFWAYRKWVFLAPAPAAAQLPGAAPVSAPAPAAAQLPGAAPVSARPPWEVDLGKRIPNGHPANGSAVPLQPSDQVATGRHRSQVSAGRHRKER